MKLYCPVCKNIAIDARDHVDYVYTCIACGERFTLVELSGDYDPANRKIREKEQ